MSRPYLTLSSSLAISSALLVCSISASIAASANNTATMVKSPAGANSMAPRLVTAGDGKHWLSWLEREDKINHLRISAFQNGQFSPAQTIKSGSDWFANWADTPHLFVDDKGWMVAQWLQKSGASTYAYDVSLSYTSDGGENWSEALVPHDDGTASEHGFVSFFPHDQGAGMVWLDGRNTVKDQPMTLRGGILNPEGEILHSAEIDVQVCDCCQTGSAALDDGAFIVYRDRTDAEIRDIYAAHFDGATWSDPIRVSNDDWTIAGCPVNGPQAAGMGQDAAVAWFTMADENPTVKLSRSQRSLSEFVTPVIVSQGDTLGRVALAYTGKHLVVSWIDEDNNKAELKAAWYDPETLTQSHQAIVAEVPRGRSSGFPSLAVIEPERVLISFTAKEEKDLSVQTALLSHP